MLQRAVSVFALLVIAAVASAGDGPAAVLPASFGEPALPVRGWIENFSYGEPQFSPDGQRLLIGNTHKGCVYDLATMKPICQPFPADWNANGYCYAGGGSLIFVTGDVGPSPAHHRAQYFDAATGKPVGSAFTCDGRYGESCTSSDGNRLCQQYRKADGDIEIRVMDRQTAKVVWSQALRESESEVRLNADGSVLAFVDVGQLDGPEPTSHLVRVRDGKALLTGELEVDGKPRCQLSPDGRSVLLIGGAGVLRIFDLATEKMTAQLPAAEAAKYPADALGYPEFSTDGKEVLFWRKGGQKRWSIATGMVWPVAVGQADDHVEEMRSSDGRRALCAYGRDPYNGGVAGRDVVDLVTGKPIWKFPFDEEKVSPRIGMSSDGRHVAISFAEKNQTFVVDLNDLGAPLAAVMVPAPAIPTRIGQPPLQLRGRIDGGPGYDNIHFSPDGKSIIVNDRHKSMIWDAALSSSKPIIFPADWNEPKSLGARFVNMGTLIFGDNNNYGSAKETLNAQYFDADSGKPIGTKFEGLGHGSAVSSEDGRYFAATYGQNGPYGFPPTTELRVIERVTSKVVLARTFNNGVLAFMQHISRDGRFVIYEEFGGKAVMRVMRVADGKFLFEGEFKPRTVAFLDAVGFSPDGSEVVIGEVDGFKIFDLAAEKLLYESPAFKPSDAQRKVLPIREASFSDDGTTVIYRQENDIQRWSLAEKRFLPAFLWKGRLDKLSLSRDARRMACQYRTNDVAPDEGTAVFDLDSSKCLWKWSRNWSWGNAAISPDGKRALVSDSVHGSIYAVDMDDQPGAKTPAGK